MSELTIIEQLRASVAARKDSLRALRNRIIAILEPIPVGVKLMGDNGAELCRIVALVTGASQWSNRTWERTIKGWGVMAGGKLVAECLDSSVWDGNNMHHRTTEPTYLARDWDSDRGATGLSWMPGSETRELAVQLPNAIALYMAHCERERAANESTFAL